jgi:hypothetical protein
LFRNPEEGQGSQRAVVPLMMVVVVVMMMMMIVVILLAIHFFAVNTANC